MGPELVSIIALVVLFVIGTLLPVYMRAPAISSTIVDGSPFSTNGALMLVNR